MSNYKKASEKTEILLDILLYATKNKLNITDRGDVKKILNSLGVTYIKDDINEWMSDIQDADIFLEKVIKENLILQQNS